MSTVTSMFSSLSRGYGTSSGTFDSVMPNHDTLPRIDPDVWYHRHGITVKPRASTAPAKVSVANGGHMDIPKTFVTRKGALMLFSGSDNMPQEPVKFHRLQQKRCHLKDILDCSLKLKTLERLSSSILQYGHKDFDKATAHINDKESHFILHFLYGMNKERCVSDMHSQPGKDVQFYLQDLRDKTSTRGHGASLYRARSAELQGILQHLQQTLPHFTGLHSLEPIRVDSVTSDSDTIFTPSVSTDRILPQNKALSSKKLTTSLKSLSYADQPVSMGQQLDDEAQASNISDSLMPHFLGTGWSENPVKEERSNTPIFSKRSGDQDGLLTGETCTLIEEKDIDIFSEYMSDDSEEIQGDSHWSQGRQLEVSFRKRTLDSSAIENKECVNVTVGPVQPLEPMYSDEKVSSRESSLASHEMSRVVTPESSDGHSQHEDILVSDEDGDISVSYADRTIVEVDTLISLHKDEQVFTPDGVTERVTSFVDEDVPSEPTDGRRHETFIIAEKHLSQESEFQDQEITADSEEPYLLQPCVTEEIQEQVIFRAEEEWKNVSRSIEENRTENKMLSSSKTVQKEKKKVEAKLKEETQIVVAKKMEGEESKKNELNEKRKAAEERLKKLVEEVALKKEEQKKTQEEEESSGIIHVAFMKPKPPSSKKGSSSRGKVQLKGDKTVNQTVKVPLSAHDKDFVKVMDIFSVQADDSGKEETVYEAAGRSDLVFGSAVSISKTSVSTMNTLVQKEAFANIVMPVSKKRVSLSSHTTHGKIQPKKKPALVPEHLKEIVNRKSDSQSREALEAEIGKMMSAVDSTLQEEVLQAEYAEGLSAEDFVLAQKTLMERIKTAEEQIQENSSKTESKKASPQKAKLEKKVMKKNKSIDAAKKQELAKEREAIKEHQRLEKQRRLEEVMELQGKIALKEEARKTKEADAKKKAEELAERIDSIRWEEEQIAIAEADARAQVMSARQAQREERETRRKIDLEYKKQAAIEKREKEKVMIEAARQMEQDMLHRIADAEMAKRLREEEEANREEEDMAAQERFEAELVAAEKAAEEEEEKLRDLEKQAEDEAFQRIIEEKEAAEKQRWELEKQARILKEEEERTKQELLEGEMRLKEEIRQREEEEEQLREQERERLRQLQRIEEEAKERMRSVLQQRRTVALHRREYNLNARANLDAIKQSQGFTDPWTFTYFVKWPKESYMRLMGEDPKKQKKIILPKKKPPVTDPSADAQTTVPLSVGLATF